MSDLSKTSTLIDTENTDVSYTSVFIPEVVSDKFERHKAWLKSIRHEHPNPSKHYRIGVYIRFFNQTKYADYLENHKKQFSDTIALCPKWELVDFYIDYGSSAPNMESSPSWCKLLDDCFVGKIDLIITQKVSNICKDMSELALCARLLAAQEQPIGTAKLLVTYQDALDEEIFKERLGEMSVKQLLRIAKERRGGCMGVAEAMVITYNGKKKSDAYKLPMAKLYTKDEVKLALIDAAETENNSEIKKQNTEN